jgi:DNA-binding PadR family transcriptional regulator
MSGVSPGVCDVELAREALSVVFDGQLPPFEGRWRDRIGQPAWFESVDELLGAGVDYFGPVARKRVRSDRGMGKTNVAETTNVVWLDLDPPLDTPREEEGYLVEQAQMHLNGLDALGLSPSVFIFSGRGSWAYWKLDRHVSQVDAEWLMRRLFAQFRRKGGEWNADRIARMPASVNEKTGFQAFVMSLRDVLWSPEGLAELLPELDTGDSKSSTIPSDLVFDATLEPSGRLPRLDLPDGLALYVEQCLSKNERRMLGIDGSGREQSIISRLVNAGCSDGQIALYCDHHHLPRHEEEKQRRRRGSYSWLARSIAKSRARLLSSCLSSSVLDDSPSPPLVSIGNGTYLEGEGGSPRTKSRESGWEHRRWTILVEMQEGLKKLELVEWVCSRFRVKRSQARRDLDWLEEKGYTEQLTGEHDRRVKHVYRTEQGRERLARQPGGRFRFLKNGPPLDFRKGLPSARPPAEVSEVEGLPAQEAPALGVGVMVPEPSSRLRTWEEEAKAADRAEDRRRQRSLINGVFRIHIPGTHWTYFQPLIPLEQWVKVRLHEQLPVAQDEYDLLVYRSFISPKDPNLDGEDAADPIERRTLRDRGWAATDRRIGWAAQLEHTDDGIGFRLASRLEDGEERPNIGLVVQADQNFYEPLMKNKYLHDRVICVCKRGSGLDTRYDFARAGDPILIDVDEFDLDAFLEHLADPAEMQTVIDTLPADWYFSRRSTWAR